VEILE
jgi:hypothetical protein